MTLHSVNLRNSIALRYFLVTASVLILGQLIFSTFIIYKNFSQEKVNLRERAIMHVDFLSQVTPDNILANNFYPIEKLMQQTTSDPDFVYSVVVTTDGNPITTSLNAQDPRVQEALATAEQPNTLSRIQYLSELEGVVEVESQIVADTLLIGSVRLGYATDSLYDRLENNIFTTLLGSGILSVLLAVVTIALFNVQILRPLRDLGLLTRQFAQGHLAQRADVTGNTEISQLQRAFNEMASQVQGNIIELRKLSQVASRTRNGVVIADALGRVEWVNEAFTTITGYTLQDVEGQTPGSVLQGEKSDPEIIQYMHDHLRQGQGFNVEVINYHKSGREYWVDIEVRPVHDANGQLINFVGIESDITERKRSESALRSALEKERELGELKSRFVTTASHEFRTPLTTILQTASFLAAAEGQVGSEKRIARLNKIQSAAKDMTALLNDVLTYGKSDANRLDFYPGQLNIVAFIEEIREDVLTTATQMHDIRLVNKLTNPVVVVDEKLMRQIITNLLVNAVKYSPKGGEITLEISCDDNRLEIIVCDQGMGIPEDELDHLFSPFHRARNVGNIAGTGLGLAIAKKAIEAHSGMITVTSQINEGTCFTATILQGSRPS